MSVRALAHFQSIGSGLARKFSVLTVRACCSQSRSRFPRRCSSGRAVISWNLTLRGLRIRCATKHVCLARSIHDGVYIDLPAAFVVGLHHTPMLKAERSFELLAMDHMYELPAIETLLSAPAQCHNLVAATSSATQEEADALKPDLIMGDVVWTVKPHRSETAPSKEGDIHRDHIKF